MSILIDTRVCTGCGVCSAKCVYDAIHIDKLTGKAVLSPEYSCVFCLQCISLCPVGAIDTTNKYI
ncbi:Ferredoxin Fd3 [Giardia muris]|uniref:Ferredoxin Fd3 n=1 Tax=Giardia muris TaxID=5742 RepID=A0A4Z1T7F7_GIAMU|nr:Ferredoxin Fd3 [Giardia muris]|eukprot:TNJ28431.1 Ferredoxin Fd3 [Giardia muris]